MHELYLRLMCVTSDNLHAGDEPSFATHVGEAWKQLGLEHCVTSGFDGFCGYERILCRALVGLMTLTCTMQQLLAAGCNVLY